MSAPDPRANPLLLGHEAAEASIMEALRSGRLHHGWLIAGPEGVGKATLAYRMARRVLGGLEEGKGLEMAASAPLFRRVASGTHADLLTVEREWDEKKKKFSSVIKVDTVREAVAFMHLTPAEGGWRVVVVDGAEDMNPNSANALLKILEEPPGRALLLLVCSAPARLLPTIRSRCRTLTLEPLGEAAMDRLLDAYLPDIASAQRVKLAELAEGSPGRALLLAEGDGLRLAGLVEGVLGALPNPPPEAGYALADAVGRGEDAYSTFMDLLRAALARGVREAARGRAAGWVSQRPLAAWVDVWHALGKLQGETEGFYLDKRQALISGLELLRG